MTSIPTSGGPICETTSAPQVTISNMTAPGWYPDGSGSQRYWDGQAWTSSFAPVQQPPPMYYAPQATAVAVSVGRGGCNHALHLVLTLFTCGMWLPVWIICAIVQR